MTKQTHKDPAAIPYLSNYRKQSIHDARCNPIKSRWGWDVGTEADRDDNRARSGQAGTGRARLGRAGPGRAGDRCV